MPLYSQFSDALTAHLAGVHSLLVGFSGGLDSTVALHLAQRYATQHDLALRAIHINHGLQEQAGEWQLHCQQQAKLLDAKFLAEQVSIQKAPRQSLEALARDARYHSFAQHLQSDELLITAHHGDDQLETLLLNLKRGSGVNGLAAMPVSRPFAANKLVRPLLGFSRKQLEGYALRHKLSWVEDPSNQSDEFDRNFLRQQVIPLFSDRWPQFLSNSCRSIELLQEAQSLNQDLATIDQQQCMQQGALLCDEVLSLSTPRQNNLLRYWLSQQGWSYPSAAQLSELRSQLEARADAKMAVSMEQGELRRFRGRLYAVPTGLLQQPADPLTWDIATQPQLRFAHGGLLDWFEGGNLLPPEGQVVTIRFRHQVDNLLFDALERAGRRNLKKLLQEADVSPWQRARIPLVFYDEELVAIAGCYSSRTWQSMPGAGIGFRWTDACPDRATGQPD